MGLQLSKPLMHMAPVAGTKQIDESEREREVPASGAALIGSIAEPSEA